MRSSHDQAVPSSHTSLVAALRDPACYPHPVDRIRVVETHISWVVLTGTIAYKIKKPVELSFVDFSTLVRRRHFCEEELRLNRRFAPSLYLGLSRITGSAGAPRIDPDRDESPVLEYAVRLKQFDAGDELAEQLHAGGVTAGMLRNFGRDVGAVHDAADRIDIDSGYGDPATIVRVMHETFADLRHLDLAPSQRDRLDVLSRRVAEITRSLHDRFAGRLREGAVRECHGDLHVGNIVSLDGRLTAFDCIEFDAALRSIDVMSDVAFLCMDLDASGHTALAYDFLEGWLETTGDFAGLALLPYYTCYRALVRAKVTGLRLPHLARAEVPLAQRQLERYLDAAERALRPRKPVLAITMGLSGSGKTHLSDHLLGTLPAVRVRSDVERKRLAGLGSRDSSRSASGAGIYTREFNERTYSRLLECARAALSAGENVILDAAFLRRAERNAARELARAAGVPYVQIACEAPEAVLRRRIGARAASGGDASEATVAVLERQLGYLEPLTPAEHDLTVRIDTTRDDTLGTVTRAIERRRAED